MTLARLQTVFQGVFEDPGLTLRPETTAEDVPGWDSFAQVTLVIALEGEFGVTFTAEEIANMVSVGEIIQVLRTRSIDIEG